MDAQINHIRYKSYKSSLTAVYHDEVNLFKILLKDLDIVSVDYLNIIYIRQVLQILTQGKENFNNQY